MNDMKTLIESLDALGKGRNAVSGAYMESRDSRGFASDAKAVLAESIYVAAVEIVWNYMVPDAERFAEMAANSNSMDMLAKEVLDDFIRSRPDYEMYTITKTFPISTINMGLKHEVTKSIAEIFEFVIGDYEDDEKSGGYPVLDRILSRLPENARPHRLRNEPDTNDPSLDYAFKARQKYLSGHSGMAESRFAALREYDQTGSGGRDRRPNSMKELANAVSGNQKVIESLQEFYNKTESAYREDLESWPDPDNVTDIEWSEWRKRWTNHVSDEIFNIVRTVGGFAAAPNDSSNEDYVFDHYANICADRAMDIMTSGGIPDATDVHDVDNIMNVWMTINRNMDKPFETFNESRRRYSRKGLVESSELFSRMIRTIDSSKEMIDKIEQIENVMFADFRSERDLPEHPGEWMDSFDEWNEFANMAKIRFPDIDDETLDELVTYYQDQFFDDRIGEGAYRKRENVRESVPVPQNADFRNAQEHLHRVLEKTSRAIQIVDTTDELHDKVLEIEKKMFAEFNKLAGTGALAEHPGEWMDSFDEWNEFANMAKIRFPDIDDETLDELVTYYQDQFFDDRIGEGAYREAASYRRK